MATVVKAPGQAALPEHRQRVRARSTGSDAMMLTVIVEDEPLAQEVLRPRLADVPHFTVVADAADGAAAVRAITEHRPGLVLLDSPLPDCIGFDVLEHLEPGHRPFVGVRDGVRKAERVHATKRWPRDVAKALMETRCEVAAAHVPENQVDDMHLLNLSGWEAACPV